MMGADTITHKAPSLAMLSRRANNSVVDKPSTTRNTKIGTLKVKDVLEAARDEVESLTTPKVGNKRISRAFEHRSSSKMHVEESPGPSALQVSVK